MAEASGSNGRPRDRTAAVVDDASHLLPLPSTTSNHSQVSFTMSEVLTGMGKVGDLARDLPADVATADLRIAADGSFVETTFAPAAFELKRRWDLMTGAGKNGVISPYAITSVHHDGQQYYRVSDRKTHAIIPEAKPTATRHRSHKSRLSVGSFLPPSIFKSNPPERTARRASSSAVSSSHTGSPFNPRLSSSFTDITSSADTSSIPLPHLDADLSSSAGTSSVLGSNSSSRHSLNNVFGTSPSVVPATNVKRLSPPDSLSLVNEEERSVTPIMTPKPTIYTSYLPKPSMPQPYISSFPFGPNVISFVEPPAPPPASLLLPRPERERHTLREAQSFESTSTARIDIGDITMKHSMSGYVKAHPESTLPSTEIWDVIQGYTIQSENPSDSPRIAPPSDPRFVVWGDVQFDRVARSGILTTTTVVSPVSRKKTNKNKKTKEPFVTAPERAIVAASIERWIAQLTSEIDFVELHILLLTYRQFIAPTDLFHLLASRFCWALEPSRDPQDDIVRKLVRIRTFSALRYWLDTFFREDFVPNWRLCRLFTNWVNSLGKDPAVKKFPEVVSIRRKLNKCIREAKEKYGHEGKDAQRESKKREQSSGLRDDYTAHCVSAYSSILRDDCVDLELPTSPIAPPGLETTSAPVLVPAPQPTKGGEKMTIEEDQDVDLDFSTILEAAEDSFGNDVDFSPRKDGGGRNQGRSGSITSRGEIGALGSSVYTPRQSTSASQINAITPLLHPSLNGLAATNLPEPAQHGPISRAFVKTMHSLSKWKRVLNNRSAITTPLTCADASAFDVEFSATGDLLIVKGGVEQYLKWLEVPHSTTNLTDGMRSTHTLTDDSPSELAHDTTDDLFVTGPVFDPPQLERPSVHESRSSTFVSDLAAPHSEADDSEPETPDHAESIVRPEIISLDEFELSDSDESQAGGRAPRRLPRRLPLRRDLEFMRQSVDTISSLGALQEADYRDSIHSTSAVSDTSEVSSSGRGAPILEWQMNLIESDEDEPGDAEAALRKLEGQIDVARQAAKAQKVASWMKTVEERRAAGETAEVSAVDDSSIVDEEHENEREPDGRSSIDAEQPPSSAPVSPLPNEESQPATAEPRSSLHNSLYPTPESRDSSTPTPSDMGSVLNMPKSQRKLSNMASTQTLTRSSLLQKASILTSVNNRTQPSGKFSLPAMPAVHRSFILSASSDSLAHQFCLIERDLLLRIKLGEVVSMKWLEHTEKTLSVVDWIPFYKDRMKQKSKADHTDTFAASDLFTSRARFTLMVNFTASEIVLTHPTERVVVISKFIRLAWKLYRMNNFSALVAVIRGLQSKPVELSMHKLWNRVPVYETRIFNDLKVFTSAEDNFRFVREATAVFSQTVPYHSTLVALGGIPGINKARGLDSIIPCVPFLGIYLNEIKENMFLPDFVDPSAPREPVDPTLPSTAAGVRRPEAFSTFDSLPHCLPLKPLVNTHKQRLNAGVFRSFVAGQYLALNYPSNSQDGKLYHKCWRLRCLDDNTLMQVASMYSP